MCASFATSLSASAQNFDDLLYCVPDWANTIAVFRIREMNNSPRGQKEQWAKKHEADYLNGAPGVPPWASFLVVASEWNLNNPSQSRKVGLIPAERIVPMESIANRHGGAIQMMNGRQVVYTPNNNFVVGASPVVFGATSGMSRQETARWVRTSWDNRKLLFSSFLQKAISANKTAHFLLAVDTQEMINITFARFEILQANLPYKAETIEALIKMVVGTQGLTVTAQITDDGADATATVEFNREIGELAGPVAALLPKVLDHFGLDLPEFKTAQPRAQGNKLILKTSISDRTLTRLMILIGAPGTDAGEEEPSMGKDPKQDPKVIQKAVMGQSSMRYYKSLHRLVDDLYRAGAAKADKNVDYNRSALLYETYANRITQLPTRDVDPELLKYGEATASRLRSMADSLRGAQIQLNVYDSYQSVMVANGGMTSYFGYRHMPGGISMESNIGDIRLRQADLVAKLEPERLKLWRVMDEDRSKIRKAMADKYGIDFEKQAK